VSVSQFPSTTSPDPARLPPQVAQVSANGIEIAYETFGDPDAPPLVLVMGLGTQMLGWPDGFCEDLAGRGHYVVRFDNRDVGLSTHLDHLPVPSTTDILLRRPAPYGVDDMADDLLGLLDGLDLRRVHLVGASMGGYVCQSFALRHAERLRSLTLLMTSTGSRRVGQPKPRLLPSLVARRGVTTCDEAVDRVLRTFRVIGSPGYPMDEEHLRELARRSWERGLDEAGYRRQLAAATGQPDRTRGLRRLDVPTLVLHGLHDPLVNVTGGLAVARAVPRSTFVGFSGMGHDLPRQLRPVFAEHIAQHTRRASGVRQA
jgi:pimeloyl-ACP methyl ester carboxylesterase